MASTVFPAISKTMFCTTLTSGTSYTVPAGVTYLNVTLAGGGQGGGTGAAGSGYPAPSGITGTGGQVISSTLSTTPGASIAYAIGAGGTGASNNGSQGGSGGTTTFTGATSATGSGGPAGNGGQGATAGSGGSNGAAGFIYIEYWV
jgi:hypothetical protein